MSYIGQQLPADVFSGYVTDSFTGDGSATTFTLSKAPFSEDTLIVVINNVIQKPTTNFTVSGTTLTIVGTAVASGDVIYAIHTGGVLPITTASKLDATTACTITTSDNTDTLSLISTDADANAGPNLRLYRNSSSPADSDYNGAIQWEWRNDNSQDVVGAEIQSFTRDASDGTEDNILWFQNMTGGTLTEFLRFDTQSDQALITFNENSNDIDFRVESNGKTHALFVDGGNDKVGIINSTPNSFEAGYNDLVIGDTDTHHGLTIVAGTSHQSDIAFADGTSGDAKYRGFVVYQHQTDKLLLGASGLTTVKILKGNNITVDIDSDATTDTTAALQLDKGDENAASSTRMIGFIVGGQGRGYILNGTSDSGAPSFGAGSDRRLKKNITAYTGGYDKIKAIPVQTWDEQFTDTTGVRGWIADELETVFPEAVTGTKDATKTVTNAIISEHGNFLKENVTEEEFEELKSKGRYTNCTWSASKVVPAFQMSAPLKFFPDVVQALQAAITKIETLETKVKALEDA